MLTVPFQNYFGGKSGAGVYQLIINHIPPHRVFMSLFAGNCGILKHIRPAETTIINDLDLDVVRAWEDTGVTLKGGYEVKHGDALDFLKHDINDLQWYRQKEHIFIYLDPPYLFETCRGQLPVYKHEMDVIQHIELLTLITGLYGYKVMISHYPCDTYDNVLLEKYNWNNFDFKATTRKGMATVRIYYNYQLDGHLHDYSFIGSNFREREAMKRRKENWFAKLDRMSPLERNAMLQEYELQYRIKQR